MQLSIHHITRYSFSEPVTFALQQLRKTPKTNAQQSVVEWETDVTGGSKQLWFEDHHRNVTELIAFDRGAQAIEIVSRGTVEVEDSHGVIGPHRGPVPLWLYTRSTRQTTPGKGARALVHDLPQGAPLDRLHALSEAVRARVDYTLGASAPDWTAEDALTAGKGVCQDHSHIFLTCARLMDMPARYVSGYLMLNDRVTQNAMHAWAETHVDGLGWVGFDVSNGISPDARYVRVATGLDYTDAAPISGTRIGGATESLDVEIQIAQQ